MTAPVLRVGLFGLLGAGNIGNDGSLEAVLTHLRTRHPDAVLSCHCSGPEVVATRYGIPTSAMYSSSEDLTASGPRTIVAKLRGKIVDLVRTVAWVRRHDVVIVPGMGVLEATLPLRPWGFPFALLALGVAGRLTGTRVALVSVGADVVAGTATRWVITRAARLAHYRSYRDELSRVAMRAMGVDVTGDEVYPDLAFGLPSPPTPTAATGVVGVGVMDYRGGNDDRERAGEIYGAYLDAMKRFVAWLVDGGREVRLFTGDDVDRAVVTEILSDLAERLPGHDPSRVVAEPAATLSELMSRMAGVDCVVATRYHNVLCAMKLNRPTLSIGYAAKNDVLMAAMGLGQFCQSARSIDLERLIEQFVLLEQRREQLMETMVDRNRANTEALEHQFAALSAAVLRTPPPVSGAGHATQAGTR